MLPPPLDRHCERSVPTCLGVGRVALSAGAVGLDDIFVIGDSSGTVMGLKTEDGLGKADIRHFTSGSLDDSVHNPLLFGQWHDGPVSCKNPRVCLTCAPPNPQPAAMILKFSVYGCETFPSVTASHSPSASPFISRLQGADAAARGPCGGHVRDGRTAGDRKPGALAPDDEGAGPHNMDNPPKRWPNHLGLRCNALPEHQMALINSGCVPFRRRPHGRGSCILITAPSGTCWLLPVRTGLFGSGTTPACSNWRSATAMRRRSSRCWPRAATGTLYRSQRTGRLR